MPNSQRFETCKDIDELIESRAVNQDIKERVHALKSSEDKPDVRGEPGL